jgi:transglutaminase-like putative cysteine protease
MIFDIHHWTEYRYSESVPVSRHLLHLLPRELPYQHVISSSLDFVPSPPMISEHVDYFGNRVATFMIAKPHVGLHINCRSRVEVSPRECPALGETIPWEQAVEATAEAGIEVGDFVYPSAYVPWLPSVRDWAQESFPAGRPVFDAAMDLTERIFNDFRFDKAATIVSTPLAEVFEKRRGVCQDFAHFQIACLRAMGLAARYLSGYVRTIPPPGRPRLFGADASHAWVGLFCPGRGWLEFDPTNNRVVDDEYVTVAWGRDYGDVSLIRGTLAGGGDHSLYLSVDVEVVGE